MLLAVDESPPFTLHRPDGASPFVLVGDHASAAVPRALASLGLERAELSRHIALDLGVDALGRALSARLDAPFVAQRYSRLVCDANRDPSHPACVAESSDGTAIPGNTALSAAERAARVAEVHAPYHTAIGALLDARAARGMRSVLVALHSFTPQLRSGGTPRPWHVGVLYGGGDERFAVQLLTALGDEPGLCVAANEPYRFDGTDYTVPLHASARALPYVELELRQDTLAEAAGVAAMANTLERALTHALAALRPG
jgi:predicted N-formylglutamate amidohydrolase